MYMFPSQHTTPSPSPSSSPRTGIHASHGTLIRGLVKATRGAIEGEWRGEEAAQMLRIYDLGVSPTNPPLVSMIASS